MCALRRWDLRARRHFLGVSGGGQPAADPLLVVVEVEGGRAGLIVEDLLAQQQIVIKSLTTNFRPVPGLSGATILGDGTVAMILDVNSVMKLYQLTTRPDVVAEIGVPTPS